MAHRAHNLAHLQHAPGPRGGADQILDVAEQLFARNGFAATSMRDLAQAARVNVATLYYHCGSKQELFDLIFRRVVGVMTAFVTETFAEGGEFEAIAGRIIDRVVEHFARHPSVPRLLVRAHLGRSMLSAYGPLLERVAVELDHQAALGKIRPVRPKPFVSAASGVILHLIIDATELDGPTASAQQSIDPATVASLQAHARMFVLGALGLDPQQKGDALGHPL